DGRQIGHGLAGAAADRGADTVQNVLAGHQRRLHISRKLLGGGGGRSRSLSHALTGPTFIGAGRLRIQLPSPAGANAAPIRPAISNIRGCVISQAKARKAHFSIRFWWSRVSAFLTSDRSSSSTLGMSILTGQTSPQAPQRLDANGSPGS